MLSVTCVMYAAYAESLHPIQVDLTANHRKALGAKTRDSA
jgi:hypothetical protein